MPATLEVPTEVLVWTFGGKSGNIRSQNSYATNTGYNLYCATNSRYLGYVKGVTGINMGFLGNGTERKWHLRLPDGKERDILAGEPFALGLGGSPSFLRYKEQPIGINLEYVKSPVFEWRMTGATGQEGQPLPAGSPVAIINTKVEPDPDFLIYFDRTAGADIGWTTSPGFWDRVGDVATKVAITALKKALA